MSAEVKIHGGADLAVAATCFSLAALPNADLPVISSARTQLVRSGTSFQLVITGTQPIAEPVFIIALRAGCGIELRRDYVLMPNAPLASNERHQPPSTTIATATSRKPANFRKWSAEEGETLESIAKSLAPNSTDDETRLLTAIQRANPDLLGGQALTKGISVRIPNLVRPTSTKQTAKLRRPPAKKAPSPSRQDKIVRSVALTEIDTKGTDHVFLGTEPASAKREEIALAPRSKQSELSEMNERMLRLETSLHTLNQQIGNLNGALDVTAEAIALRQKLQAMQEKQRQAAAGIDIKTASAPPLAASNTGIGNWLELLISALAGGGISAGIASMLSRRRTRHLETLPTRPAAVPRPKN